MSMFREAVQLLKKSRAEKSVSLWFRLFAFFGMYVICFGLAFVLILMLSGVFNEGERESRAFIENELDHLTENASQNFGKLSYHGTQFARELSAAMNQWAKENDIKLNCIQDYPALLTPLLKSQIERLLSVLENNNCSGSLVILDASVNPGLSDSKSFKAGIFLKRTEPNTITSVASKIHYLRGPASIARSNKIELLGQWQMEFDVSEAAFYQKTIQKAIDNRSLPLSRLYYWSERYTLEGNSESGMLLCLPLSDEEGNVYGICGIEVSAMLFKLQYSPDNSRYPYIFSVIAPEREEKELGEGLIAGNSYLTNLSAGALVMTSDHKEGLQTYQSQDGTLYVGMSKQIKLYASDSPYADLLWRVAVMMPKYDWKSAVASNNLPIYLAMLVLTGISLALAAWISKRFIQPVIGVFNQIKSEALVPAMRTNIIEIDDLLVFLEKQDAEKEIMAAELERIRTTQNLQKENKQKNENELPDLSAYREFVKNIDSLSQAERAVFELYMKGHTAREITELLCLSINTIKTHNKRIYNKLNVSSRKELMVYVQMMAKEQDAR